MKRLILLVLVVLLMSCTYVIYSWVRMDSVERDYRIQMILTHEVGKPISNGVLRQAKDIVLGRLVIVWQSISLLFVVAFLAGAIEGWRARGTDIHRGYRLSLWQFGWGILCLMALGIGYYLISSEFVPYRMVAIGVVICGISSGYATLRGIAVDI